MGELYLGRLSASSRLVACSLAFDLRCGFWRSRIGNTIVALRAIDSIEDAEAKAENKRDNSPTNSCPTLPQGTLKLFILQCTTSEYVASSA